MIRPYRDGIGVSRKSICEVFVKMGEPLFRGRGEGLSEDRS
jgi:hypothetical protein